jgi:uncharacterized membrane protein YhdT
MCIYKCMLNVYKNQQNRQTGSRNLTGQKTLPMIWGTYMKLVTKYQISAINSYWEKCDKKYLGRTEGQTDRGKTVYPPPPSGSGGVMICLPQWFITSCLWLYSITFTKRSDMSITVIHHIMPLTVQYYFHQEEWHVYHSDSSRHASDCTTVLLSPRGVTCLSQWFITSCLWLYSITFTKRNDMSITVTYHIMPLTVRYNFHQEEWHVYHSDLSHHASDCTVLLSPRGVTCLSQWFITSCLWLYSITFTKRSDMSITVIYHIMPLTVQYYCH